eukprot:jgi/Astpho2/2536/Aster-x0539
MLSPADRKGRLLCAKIADPEDGCTAMRTPEGLQDCAWIPMIVRSERLHTNCTFDDKVRHAEQAGAMAAIIYDDQYEALIIMSKPLGHPDPGIPAVFVTQKTGIIVKRLMTEGVTVVRITLTAAALWISMLMSALAGMLAVSVVGAAFWWIRRNRLQTVPGQLGYEPLRDSNEGMSPAQMRALPVVMHEKRHSSFRRHNSSSACSDSTSDEGSPRGPKGGGTLKTCAVCLEDYSEGEKLRVLPCRHRFHMECIDQWLSSRRPLCPVCKNNALKDSSALTEQVAERAAAPEAATGVGEADPAASGALSGVPAVALFPIRRWRRWRWGYPRAPADARGDIEQPTHALPRGSGPPPSPASPSSSVAAVQAERAATPRNFPQMERFAASQPSAEQASPSDDTAGPASPSDISEITPADPIPTQAVRGRQPLWPRQPLRSRHSSLEGPHPSSSAPAASAHSAHHTRPNRRQTAQEFDAPAGSSARQPDTHQDVYNPHSSAL